jgi:hypothetical protein
MAWRVDGKKRVVSLSGPLISEWYEQFAKRIKNRLGKRTRQVAAISPAVMSELMCRFEEDFRSLIGDAAGEQDWSKLDEAARVDLRETIDAACFCLLSHCAGLRGFEVPRVVLREFIVRDGNVTGHYRSGRGPRGSSAEWKLQAARQHGPEPAPLCGGSDANRADPSCLGGPSHSST